MTMTLLALLILPAVIALLLVKVQKRLMRKLDGMSQLQILSAMTGRSLPTGQMPS